MLVCLFALGTTACKNDSEEPAADAHDTMSAPISIDAKEKSIQQGYFEINIDCAGQWTASANKTWITINPAAGTGSQPVAMVVVPGNDDEATVTFMSGNYKAELTVKRTSAYGNTDTPSQSSTYITASSSLLITNGDDSRTVIVTSSSPWTASSENQGVRLEPDKGPAGTSQLTITVENGPLEEMHVTLKNNSGDTYLIRILRNPVL